MQKRTVAAAAGLALVAAAIGGGVAVAGSGEQGEQGSGNYTQQQAEDATSAALKATDGGTANSVERDGENGATWEVEVTRPDGSTVDVRLDEHYQVVVIEGDHEDAGETD
ncbi:MAG: PepSY domain-containing protein [Nocardioidaceae bacterium]